MTTDSRIHAQTITLFFNFSLDFFLTDIKDMTKSYHNGDLKDQLSLTNFLISVWFPPSLSNLSRSLSNGSTKSKPVSESKCQFSSIPIPLSRVPVFRHICQKLRPFYQDSLEAENFLPYLRRWESSPRK